MTEAAHGGLKPSPTGRLRRVLLHLSYSMALSHLLDTTPLRCPTSGDVRSQAHLRGTRSSNPVPSSRESVSREISPSCIERPAVAAAWAGPARRHGRQRRAGLVNITPIAGNVSVGPYSSTAVPARRFTTVVALVRPSEVGLATRPAQAKPSTVRCSPGHAGSAALAVPAPCPPWLRAGPRFGEEAGEWEQRSFISRGREQASLCQ